MLPEFIEHDERRVVDRILPPGVHALTPDEVEAAFVEPFPKSLRRRTIFRRWSGFRAQVRSLVPVDQEFIDGSFVTSRLNPDDIDVSFWISADRIEALGPGEQFALSQLLATSKLMWDCDAYIVPVCEVTHPAYQDFLRTSAWTSEYWSNYSNPMKVVVPGVKKGFIEVQDS